jgi:hypothetical protein
VLASKLPPLQRYAEGRKPYCPKTSTWSLASGPQCLHGLDDLALALIGPLIHAFKHHSRLGWFLADKDVSILVVSANESEVPP